MVGVELKVYPAGHAMEGTGGCGRAAGSAAAELSPLRFPLGRADQAVEDFDGFFNSALLRRPGRVFDEDSLEMLNVSGTTNLRQMRRRTPWLDAALLHAPILRSRRTSGPTMRHPSCRGRE